MGTRKGRSAARLRPWSGQEAHLPPNASRSMNPRLSSAGLTAGERELPWQVALEGAPGLKDSFLSSASEEEKAPMPCV